mgnify:CR=1 FL=1
MIIISVILSILIIKLINNKIKKDDYLRLNESITKDNEEIESLLNKKKKLIKDICNSINKLNEKEVFTKLSQIDKVEDSFALDRCLNDFYNSLKEYLIINKAVVLEDKTLAKISKLKEIEINLQAEKMYYNNECEKYNNNYEKLLYKGIINKNNLEYHFPRDLEKNVLFDILKDK